MILACAVWVGDFEMNGEERLVVEMEVDFREVEVEEKVDLDAEVGR